MTDSRSLMRTLRAALFAAVCSTLAAMGHSSLSGHDLPGAVLAGAFVVSGGAAWLAGTRRRGAFSIGAGLLTVQGTLHLLFTGSDIHTTSAHDGGHTHPMGSDPMPLDAVAGAVGEPAVLAPAPFVPSIGMVAAHVIGALVCALWLARGESAFFQLARTVGCLAFAPLRRVRRALAFVRVPELPGRSAPSRTRAARRLEGVVLAHALSRRGPPWRSVPSDTAPGAYA
ncbi:hypothetical protein V1460_27365 [Streptomyces sp. SCSIO 30461]|uniref:hypothetical protein n=1 Tax=Streptomyces sp. SCSIO 30461 TaxID=3118085 RepID=UPI0030D07876